MDVEINFSEWNIKMDFLGFLNSVHDDELVAEAHEEPLWKCLTRYIAIPIQCELIAMIRGECFLLLSPLSHSD